ncbi:MAG: acetamidase/formamidase family protein [Phycisphaerales bacterium]
MHHVLGPDRPNLHAHFSRAAQAVLEVASGDSISFSTPDVAWGIEPPTSTIAPRRKVEPRDPARDNGPCMCGPVAVRGARAGDVLEIAIERVRPVAWGWTYAGAGMSTPALNRALGIGDAPLTLARWALDRQRGTATSDSGLAVPMRPFPGIIGLAPDADHSSGWTPGPTGGNMDCRELIEGTTLFLPVMVDGALLSVGDGHAAQGDAELSGTAIECALEELCLRLTLRRDMNLAGPVARTSAGWVTLGFAPTLDAAAEQAAGAMLDVMTRELGVARAEALALASACVHLRVTQIVNPLRGVHALWAV